MHAMYGVLYAAQGKLYKATAMSDKILRAQIRKKLLVPAMRTSGLHAHIPLA